MSSSENHPRLRQSGSCPPGWFCVTPPLALADWTVAGPRIPPGPIWFSPENLDQGPAARWAPLVGALRMGTLCSGEEPR